MNFDELKTVSLEQTRADIERYIAVSPTEIALNKRVENSSVVASQVKYLQRARTKLPSFYAARGILPSLSFEQSSSEQCAAHKDYSGELCVDLTCGLGVDSYFLSQKFTKVISVERDPVLAKIAQLNFQRLGVHNIEVVNSSAETFLESFSEHADLIYIDPDRRGVNDKKLVVLEDCSPNVVALEDVLRTKSDRVVIKTSPLFDVDEAFRVFGAGTCVEVVSLGGECKEVLIDLGDTARESTVKVSALGLGSAEFCRQANSARICPAFTPELYRYLIVPDVGLLKARKTLEYFAQFEGVFIDSNNGYALSDSPVAGVLGRAYRIDHIEPYNPKAIKKTLRTAGIKQVDIMKHEFGHTTAQIASDLGVSQGGKTTIAFTTIDGDRYAIFLEK